MLQCLARLHLVQLAHINLPGLAPLAAIFDLLRLQVLRLHRFAEQVLVHKLVPPLETLPFLLLPYDRVILAWLGPIQDFGELGPDRRSQLVVLLEAVPDEDLPAVNALHRRHFDVVFQLHEFDERAAFSRRLQQKVFFFQSGLGPFLRRFLLQIVALSHKHLWQVSAHRRNVRLLDQVLLLVQDFLLSSLDLLAHYIKRDPSLNL